MKLKGFFEKILPENSGVSAKGEWYKGGFVVELKSDEKYNKKAAFEVWGRTSLDALTNFNLKEEVEVTFDVESREWQSKWFTYLRCTNVVGVEPIRRLEPTQNKVEAQKNVSPIFNINDDDLPF